MRRVGLVLLGCLLGLPGLFQGAARAATPPRLVILDEDTAGPAGTDLDALLVLLGAPDVEVLGVTVVAGDGWRDDEVRHALRLLEIAGHASIPVAPGAAGPLVRTRAATTAWDERFRQSPYAGMWSNFPDGPGSPLPEGRPSHPPAAEDAAHFLVRMVNLHPHRVTILACGPLTNLALALRLDPGFAGRTAGLVLMGGSLGAPTHDPAIQADPRREFNFWFDPDAARAVLRAPWPGIIDTPQDVAVQTHFTPALKARLAALPTPAARYVVRYTDVLGNVPYMYDELAAAAWLDPALIARRARLYLDVNDDPRAPAWGDTFHAALGAPHAPGLQPVDVQLQADVARFEDYFVKALGNVR